MERRKQLEMIENDPERFLANEENIASRKVIEAAGGELYERFTMPDHQGGGPGRRYRIDLTG